MLVWLPQPFPSYLVQDLRQWIGVWVPPIPVNSCLEMSSDMLKGCYGGLN